MNLDHAMANFFYAVERSGRSRTVRRAGMTDEQFYRAELAAGTPDELARRLAGLPPIEQGSDDENA
ncbi:hypothetical protein [Micromonospora yangpuensis]|uniref:Uncharacterized protein n=1 Tax=Micromonospora yangpuensis TaxID=683228 RepID=A0A1C6U7L7_9ACTN|nr:hypothetical protein [Micromonospora yangpuensis]GGL90370.1 hypothetical protein GCM10012279_05170 [Micromonospora yangpuensis]SCL49829.1 hypothetical protein GA0070617_1298 [Micromonospora yangpuensis]